MDDPSKLPDHIRSSIRRTYVNTAEVVRDLLQNEYVDSKDTIATLLMFLDQKAKDFRP